MDVKELLENAKKSMEVIKRENVYSGARIEEAMKPVMMLCGEESEMVKKARIDNLRSALDDAYKSAEVVQSEIAKIKALEDGVVSVKCGGG